MHSMKPLQLAPIPSFNTLSTLPSIGQQSAASAFREKLGDIPDKPRVLEEDTWTALQILPDHTLSYIRKCIGERLLGEYLDMKNEIEVLAGIQMEMPVRTKNERMTECFRDVKRVSKRQL